MYDTRSVEGCTAAAAGLSLGIACAPSRRLVASRTNITTPLAHGGGECRSHVINCLSEKRASGCEMRLVWSRHRPHAKEAPDVFGYRYPLHPSAVTSECLQALDALTHCVQGRSAWSDMSPR